MKKTILLVGLFFLAISLPAGSYAAEINKSDLVPVKIYIASHDDVYKFGALGVNIEELRDGYIEARISQAKIDELASLGWKVKVKIEEAVDPKIISQYHGYNWITALLDSIHADHPSITKKISYGKSYNGYDLWAFLVTSQPESMLNKAEVRLAGNIHGDEVVGTEMLLGIIDSLTNFYGTIPEITDLVNTREIWFVPCLNPDGNLAGSRYNGHGEDLNRDFPVPDGSIGYDYNWDYEPETRAFIDYWSTKRIVLSLNYHGGALVANYPWDYTLTRCPDDSLVREISLGYARLNLPMYASTEFDSGVTNGYDWYEVRGSLQDWSYHITSGIDITVECSDIKTPPRTQLPGFWDDNRNSLMYFIRQAGWGVQGIVADSLTGLPINWASVVPIGTDKSVYTDTIGDYHRMLMTGQYDLVFTAIGYHDKTIGPVRVVIDSLTNLDVQLAPILVSGIVCDSASGDPIPGALVEIINLRSDTTDENGQYSIRWNQDDYYSLKAAASGYRAVIYDSLKFSEDSTINFDLSIIGTGVVGGPDNRVQITDFRLYQNIPNPFGKQTTISYQLPKTGLVRLNIYNITGQLVKTLVNGEQSAGSYKVKWNGRDEQNRKTSAGVYIYHLTVGDKTQSRKMIVLK